MAAPAEEPACVKPALVKIHLCAIVEICSYRFSGVAALDGASGAGAGGDGGGGTRLYTKSSISGIDTPRITDGIY